LPSFAERLAAQLPLPLSTFMALCNAHYYATRDPLGAGGDFTTAPEISQMFGELIGAWCADLSQRAGNPEVRLVELGPGRGTLMVDLLRAGRAAGFAPPVHFVETSPRLRAEQAKRVPHAQWHDAFAEVPDDLPLLIVANEFFDALPIRQFVRSPDGWRERMVAPDLSTYGGARVDALVPAGLDGDVFETSPASHAVATEIGDRLRRRGGAALIVDYGHAGPLAGDTLQAVKAHAYADPFAGPGEADLTAHVDFTALGRAAGVPAFGPVGQGDFLRALGIEARAAKLGDASGLDRLTVAMGSLFKAMALVAPRWPTPAGFR
jgi:SAM-dependent MidA family methyltransferase